MPLTHPPPNQQGHGFPLEFLLKAPQAELRTLSQNCEQTLPKLRTNRIMNKRAFLRNPAIGEHQLGYGICRCWDLQFLVSPVSSNSQCLIQAKFDMNCEATSLARTRSSGLRRKISIFRATFRAPRKRFFGPLILHFLALFAVSDEFGHIFRAPENIFGLEFGPLRRDWRRQFWAIQARR